MGYCAELLFRRKLQAKEIGNSAMYLFISRFESTSEKLCFDAYKISYMKAILCQSHSQWKNMFVTKKPTIILTNWCLYF